MRQSKRSSLASSDGSDRSRRAAWSFWTISVVRVKSTRLPSSIRAWPIAAAACVLPAPDGPKHKMLAPCSIQVVPAASDRRCALRIVGTAEKSKVAKVLPRGRAAAAKCRARDQIGTLRGIRSEYMRAIVGIRTQSALARRPFLHSLGHEPSFVPSPGARFLPSLCILLEKEFVGPKKVNQEFFFQKSSIKFACNILAL